MAAWPTPGWAARMSRRCRRGVANLARHVENVRKFGLPVLVALNRFSADTDAEIACVQAAMDGWARGVASVHPLGRGRGRGDGPRPRGGPPVDAGDARFRMLYPDDMPLAEKTAHHRARNLPRRRHRPAGRGGDEAAAHASRPGSAMLPVCVAKTQYSFSADPTLLGAPEGHVLPVRDVRLSAGAGFVVAICGDVMTMPGLPRVPAAERIGLGADGLIDGLF